MHEVDLVIKIPNIFYKGTFLVIFIWLQSRVDEEHGFFKKAKTMIFSIKTKVFMAFFLLFFLTKCMVLIVINVFFRFFLCIMYQMNESIINNILLFISY